MEFKRKFDNDLKNELSILERLSYHTTNDVGFINELEKEMKEKGLLQEDPKKKITLKIKEKAKNIIENNELYTIKNKRKRGDDIPNLFNRDKFDNIKEDIESLIKIPLFSNAIEEQEIDFNKEVDNHDKGNTEAKNLNDIINKQVFYKAMNALDFSFERDIKPFNFENREAFFESFRNIELRFNKRQDFKDKTCQLEITKYVLKHFKDQIKEVKASYSVTDFKVQRITLENEKEIFSTKEFKDGKKYEWLYYDKYSTDSNPEKEFLEFIEENRNKISQRFSQWFIVRNDGFDEFKIYDNRKSSESYAKGFEPDFIFFGKSRDKEGDGFLSIECFMEVKGKQLMDDDKWKEEFLECLQRTCKIDVDSNKNLHIPFLPFFIIHEETKEKKVIDKRFKDKFNKFLESKFDD